MQTINKKERWGSRAVIFALASPLCCKLYQHTNSRPHIHIATNISMEFCSTYVAAILRARTDPIATCTCTLFNIVNTIYRIAGHFVGGIFMDFAFLSLSAKIVPRHLRYVKTTWWHKHSWGLQPLNMAFMYGNPVPAMWYGRNTENKNS